VKYTAESIKACNAAFIEAIRDSCLSTEDFEREYLCQPARLAQLIASEDYDACVLPPPFDVVPDQLNAGQHFGDLFVGVDCARSRNYTVTWALERGFDKQDRACYRTVCVNRIKDMDFPGQYATILPIFLRADKGLIDQGTQGRALADAVQATQGSNVQPFGLSAPRMAEMAEILKAFVQMRRISLPNDPAIKRDMMCVRRKVHPNGRTLSYGGTTDDGGHGDAFWACALALYSAEGGLKSRMMLPDQTGLELEETAA
jgi:phage FluMu gp28-like protein